MSYDDPQMVPVPMTAAEIEAHNARLAEDQQRALRLAQRDALLNLAARKAARASFAREVEVVVSLPS